jgi:hypothetical protein
LSRGDLLALAAVALAYAIVFVTTRNPEPGELLVQVTRNIIPLALTAVLARHALRRWVIPLVGWRHRVAQVLLAVVFTFGWLWLLTVTAGLLDGDGPTRFQVYPFLFGPAVEWQLLQGFAFYLALAALTMLEARPPATGLVIIDDCAGVVRDRFLVRQDEEIAPILASDIVSVVGADDYTQVQTTNTQILVSTTLSEWEAALDPTRFLRAHRSAIVNLDRMLRAEPAGGGRTTLRMETGPDITASRTGTKLLRERLS